jgi:L-aspartate oxidase
MRLACHTLIIGSGLAGMSLALHLADHMDITLVSKRRLDEGNSSYAQGGIAGWIDGDDSIENHIRDTLIAGAGLCQEEAVRRILYGAPDALDWLIRMGVPFTADTAHPSGFHLTREGGHSHRRILHAADATGAAIISTLMQKIQVHPRIRVLEHHTAIDLIPSYKVSGLVSEPHSRCLGAYVFNQSNAQVCTIAADHTILASGGAGKVYLYTTNPDTATGDGVAMAWRAGCRVANMEFMQFHPTCLFHPHAKSFLISEAVRGEGGILRRPDGSRFMPDYDDRAELAPRDIVARAIDAEIKKHGFNCVYLDISHQSKSFILEHFPMIYEKCQSLGIDISTEPIPVVPAAHYTCGGVITDAHGQTDLKNLYAVGEVTHTGLHGANRLASNSLLECIVMAQAVAHRISSQAPLAAYRSWSLPLWDDSQVTDADEEVILTHNWEELRRAMWDYVGIVRSNKRLKRALHRIEFLKKEIEEYYSNFKVSRDLIETRDLLQVAELIVRSALHRQESRGLHYNRDHPQTHLEAVDTILYPPFFST